MFMPDLIMDIVAGFVSLPVALILTDLPQFNTFEYIYHVL